jgi:hypothetical protein
MITSMEIGGDAESRLAAVLRLGVIVVIVIVAALLPKN